MFLSAGTKSFPGDVCKCTEYFDEKKARVFEITFSTVDAYK